MYSKRLEIINVVSIVLILSSIVYDWFVPTEFISVPSILKDGICGLGFFGLTSIMLVRDESSNIKVLKLSLWLDAIVIIITSMTALGYVISVNLGVFTYNASVVIQTVRVLALVLLIVSICLFIIEKMKHARSLRRSK